MSVVSLLQRGDPFQLLRMHGNKCRLHLDPSADEKSPMSVSLHAKSVPRCFCTHSCYLHSVSGVFNVYIIHVLSCVFVMCFCLYWSDVVM